MKTTSVYIECIKTTIEYHIGGNAAENFELIDNAEPNDIWFHVDGLPSAHIVASIPESMRLDKKQWLKIAKQGSVLCKQHSKYASQKNLPIVFTEIKNVEKTDVIGRVNITNQRTVYI
jgi:predicted ribosome quality control (RQC) complex YloA/Tae2 family protein